ncbi:hypothetical protein [Methylocaldum marinum]|uniref:hypothetical protein n=1 Tax=Methylocaldum marinum TaxID=1432792 RepID=UPI0011AE24FC|nr:hypothetical protein [Methylocaldum marinum]
MKSPWGSFGNDEGADRSEPLLPGSALSIQGSAQGSPTILFELNGEEGTLGDDLRRGLQAQGRQRLAQRLGPMISRRFCLLWNAESRYKVGNPLPTTSLAQSHSRVPVQQV